MHHCMSRSDCPVGPNQIIFVQGMLHTVIAAIKRDKYSVIVERRSSALEPATDGSLGPPNMAQWNRLSLLKSCDNCYKGGRC